jgi:hypothetical protein
MASDRGTRRRWMVSYSLLHPGGRATGTQWIGGWVDPRVGLDAEEKRKVLHAHAHTRTHAHTHTHEGQSRSSKNSLTSTVWFGASGFRTTWTDCYWLLVCLYASFAEVSRFSPEEAARQVAGQWFLHHDNAPSNTTLDVRQFLVEKTLLSSPNHRTPRFSLQVTFSYSLLWKWSSRGHVPQPWRTSNRMQRPDSRRFQMKPSVGACNNGRIDGTSVCAQASYFEGD